MIIFENIFWIGVAVVIFAMLLGFGLAKNYSRQKAQWICVMHMIGLGFMAYGVPSLAWAYGFQNTWWQTGGQVLFFMLAFGALMESRKMLPMAPKNLQEQADRLAKEEEAKIAKSAEDEINNQD